MFQITPIGSCRVAGPLQLAQPRFGYGVNKARSYGYCHSSGEAVQLVQFMLGQFTPPKDTWPLIARSVEYDTVKDQRHELSDLYIIEISSSKRITIDGVFIQLNYLTNAFRSFFEDQKTARGFWDTAGKGDQAAIDRYLGYHCTDEKTQQVLRRVRMHLTTPTQLAEDMRTLTAMLPRVLFLTHVNARKPSGAPLASRDAFITRVKDTAHAQGATVYDPTLRMIEVGQKEAIADYSEGLAHYTDPFAQELVTDWAALSIIPALDDIVLIGDDTTVQNMFLPHALAQIEHVAFSGLEPRLKKLIRSRPDLPGLEDIATLLCRAKNDAEGLYDRLDPDDNDPKGLRHRLALAFDLGKFTDIPSMIIALEAQSALPPTRHLLQIGRAAADRGYMLVALTVLSAALEAAPTSAATASMLAELLLAHGEEALRFVPESTRIHILDNVTPLNQIRVSDAGGWDHTPLMEDASADDLVEVVAHLTMAGQTARAAKFIVQWRESQEKTPPIPRDICAMLDRWVAAGQRLEKTTGRIQSLNDVLLVDPQHRTARIALRDIRRTLRESMRAAAANQDKAALDELISPNSMLATPLLELDLYRARERFEAEDYPAAIKAGRLAAKALPDNISVWVLLMRAAVRSHQLVSVDKYAQKVIALSDVDTARLEAEAVNYLHRNAEACAKAAKVEGNARKAASLNKIAQRHTPVFKHKKVTV